MINMLRLINNAKEPTFYHSAGGSSIIDLTWTTANMYRYITD